MIFCPKVLTLTAYKKETNEIVSMEIRELAFMETFSLWWTCLNKYLSKQGIKSFLLTLIPAKLGSKTWNEYDVESYPKVWSIKVLNSLLNKVSTS